MPEGVGKRRSAKGTERFRRDGERHRPLGLQPLQRDALQAADSSRAWRPATSRIDLVGALVQPRLVVAQRRGEQAHHVPVALGLAQRRDGRRVVLQIAVAVGLVQVDLLQLARGGQDDVGLARGVGHEQFVDDGEEVVALHALR